MLFKISTGAPKEPVPDKTSDKRELGLGFFQKLPRSWLEQGSVDDHVLAVFATCGRETQPGAIGG